MPELPCIIVVPCYNEATRLKAKEFLRFADTHPHIHFLFVDDGSTDATRTVLQNLAASDPTHMQALIKPQNDGKAETVRIGMNTALAAGAYPLIGFWDADLATPLNEIPQMLTVFAERPNLGMVFGSRVRLLGRSIHRKAARHYLGRLFATAASVTLGLPIYDTQCGAKIFRATPELQSALAQPFISRWIFDVEIIARYIQHRGRRFCIDHTFEFPLHNWRDVGGSKLHPTDFLVSLTDLLKIRRRYLSRAK